MNSMELVRSDSKYARPVHRQAKRSRPAFYEELAGATRGAILRARDHLLSKQSAGGTWISHQTSDVSLASQLVFLLVYLDRADTELVAQLTTGILDEQLPSGGWTASPDGRVDMSASVQAYFALKLTGIDATEEPLCRARQVIRDLGGADVADETTRVFLALFGQIGYRYCRPIQPEWLLFGAHDTRRMAPRSIIWAHQAVRDVGAERGARELFIKRPCDWPPCKRTSQRSRLGHVLELMVAHLQRLCERRGWTPLRRRGLNVAEALVLNQVASRRISELSLEELIWHIIASHSAGHDSNSAAWRSCEAQLDAMIPLDQESEKAAPTFKRAPLADTVMVLQSLGASGLATNHPAVAAAVESLRQMRRATSVTLSTTDLSQLIQLIGERVEGAPHVDDALPPDIMVTQIRPLSAGQAHCRGPRCRLRAGKIAGSLIQPLLSYQNRDGGWPAQYDSKSLRRASQVDATASVLMALENFNSGGVRQAKAGGVNYLRASQQADGSWADDRAAASLSTTSRAICGLLAAGVDSEDEAIAAGINWLVIHQYESSSGSSSQEKVDARQAEISDMASVLLALVAAGKANHPAARCAVERLLELQRDEGCWSETGFNHYDSASGRWLRSKKQSTARPLLALSRWIVAAATAQEHAGQEMSFRLVGVAAVD